jgi:site-specific recombinase XerC
MKRVTSNEAKIAKKCHEKGGLAAQDGTRNGTKTAQKPGRRTEADRTVELENTLPVGITIGRWTGERGKPFYVRHGRDRKVVSFEGEQDRNDYAEKLAQKRETGGTEALDFDPAVLREWRAFRARCPAPLHELERLWAKHEAARKTLVSGCAGRYLANWSGKEPGFDHIKLHLKRLTDAYGSLPIGELTGDLLRELARGLTSSRSGKPVSEVTRYDHRKSWSRFLNWCVIDRVIDFNPCESFVLSKPKEQDRDILTARQIFDVLKANRNEPVIGRMAFELFGGLRSSSAARLRPELVRRDIKGIRMPGAEHKSTKAKFRQGHPEVLWAWHDHAAPGMWGVTTGSYDERKHDAFVRAHVANPGNVLRSSFATYLLALTNNPGLVARLMQHTSLSMLEIYEGVASREDAELVMAMTPDAVKLSWDHFVAKLAAAKGAKPSH